MLLIYPPAAKPSEPPAGITQLATALKQAGIPTEIWDANLDAFYWSLERSPKKRRKNRNTLQKQAKRNSELLRQANTFKNIQKYRKAVTSLNKLINLKAPPGEFYSLADYRSEFFSTLNSGDLKQYALNYKNAFFTPFFREQLQDLPPETMVGISLQFLNQVLPVMSLIGFLKNEIPDCRIILGGGLLTSWQRTGKSLNFLKKMGCTLIDGPGEEPLIRLKTASWQRSQIDVSSRETKIELHGLENQSYLSPSLILPVSFSSGCYYRKCTFCPETAENTPYAGTNPEKMIPAVNAACRRYEPGLIHILDNEISPRYLNALVKTPLDAPWYGFTRFYSSLKDPDFCQELAKANCRMLKLGLESGSQKVLDSLGKGQRIEDTETILNNLKSAGITTYVYLMFGTPAENREKAEETLAYCIRQADNIDFMNCAIFNLPVSSEIYRHLETKEFYSGDLSLYSDFKHPEGWNRRKVRGWLQNCFKKHPAIKPILERTPFSFNANHAVFFMQNSCSWGQ